MSKNRIKKRIILACVICAAVGLIFMSHQMRSRQKADCLYQNVYEQLKDFPSHISPDGYCVLYHSDGVEEYLLFYSGGIAIAGKRGPDGTVYYVENQGCFDENGAPLNTEFDEQAFIRHIDGVAESYFSQEGVTYTYHTTSGSELPKWITPEDREYLRIERPGYTDCMEVMTGDNTENSRYVRWNILLPGEYVELYLSLSERVAVYKSNYVRGWGDIPEQILP